MCPFYTTKLRLCILPCNFTEAGRGSAYPYIVLTGANSDAINKGTIQRVLNGEYKAVYFIREIIFSGTTMIRMNGPRTNVRLEMHTQPKDAMNCLYSLLHKEKTIVYFETIADLIRVFKCLQWIKPELQERLSL
ncbi:hypothetical protein BGZ95_004102 [Linnemannia exigua]|uniref:Uncharacterized protein n=1 Tax=Linnemannia exigua TaxID=604196 RepID=A0AAD4H0Z7_9FUNG|nr:hypothetical protein BGZ95_004102 [Linnemannia exigua]